MVHTIRYFDTYRNTKHVLEALRQNHTEKLSSSFTSQGSMITHSLKAGHCLWFSGQSKLPKNVFDFTVTYPNNLFKTGKISLCGISLKARIVLFVYCLPESLLHVVARCDTYLNEGRFT